MLLPDLLTWNELQAPFGATDGIGDADSLGNNPLTTMKFPKKILLIDHEPGVTRLIRRALERAGKYLIREEHDDKLALNAARWFQPDLILVDTASQSQLSIERAVNSDSTLKDTPVLSLSNLRPESQMVSGGILSGYSFFAAPVRVEEVLRGVDELLFGKD
ncbi:MAG: two-component system, OmpR family, response regulator [Verrucomicrobiota bacterium]|jgi:PleD family two-component response regulator